VHEGFNETALYGAAGIANRPRLTKLLLDAGADPNDRSDGDGRESLYHACEHANHACLKLLLRAKPEPAWVSYCLFRKLDFEDPAGAKLMLDHGADPNFPGPAGQTSVLHAVRRGRSVTILRLLRSYGAKLDTPDHAGMTPLKLARRLGRKQTLTFLSRAGVADEPDRKEQFLAACAAGELRAARKFLAQDPTLMRRLTADDVRILPDAAAANRLRPVRHMLDLGFDINAKGDWGGSAGQQAAWNGHVVMVKLLIDRGADLLQKNDFGGNALGAAIHGSAHAGHKRGPQVVAVIARAIRVDDLTPYIAAAEKEADTRVVDALKRVEQTIAPTKGALQ
jgi:ankyrin repeat protein